MVDGATSSALIRWIPLVPLAGAVIQASMLFVARKPARQLWVVALSITPIVFSLIFAGVAFSDLIDLPVGMRVQLDFLWSWVGLGVGDEAFLADLTFRFDPLSGATCLLILVVALLIHVHALASMAGDSRPDAGYQRFFMYMGFLLSSMLVLVLGANLIIILAGWIGTGLGTALLVGFWYSDPGGERAAVRTIVFSITIDAVLMACFIGLFWSLAELGAHSTSLGDVEAGLPALVDSVIALPFGFEIPVLTLLGLGIGLAACGRSAQLPFHIAMSGVARSPAPAAAFSVLSASMGIYLCCRLSFLFAAAPVVSSFLAWAGALTAVIAAATALVQRDLVAILIASVVSQFGIAFLAIGCGAYGAAIFHQVMMAIVFSMLILSAGSVIHCLEGERDIRRMGGLNVRLVLTHLMVVIGVLSPAMFFSREQAIATAFEAPGVPGSPVLYGLALIATLLLSWAISRFLIGVFWGTIRTPLGFRGEFNDPPPSFMIPLYVLAFLSVLGVALNPAQIWGDLLPEGVEGSDSLARFLSGVLVLPERELIDAALRWELVAGSLLATLIGFSITYLFYIRFPATRIKLNARLAPVQRAIAGRNAGGIFERRVAAPLILLSYALLEIRLPLRSSSQRLRGRLRAAARKGTAWVLPAAALRAERPALIQVYFLVALAGTLIMLEMVTG
ncbi:MAG: hypothetical protein JRJ58_15910 [Deltaproteobacteria bacterium]|nr:hypothetical protein [Deltaproteobacteria bacterium]